MVPLLHKLLDYLQHINWFSKNWIYGHKNADICLYGHLHIQMRGWKEKHSCKSVSSQPRGVINERLYAKVEISDDAFQVNTIRVNTNCILAKEFTR